MKNLENSGKIWKIFETFWKILENSGNFWKILENPRNENYGKSFKILENSRNENSGKLSKILENSIKFLKNLKKPRKSLKIFECLAASRMKTEKC